MRKNPGFTLIELMVVMAIIAILATAGLSSYGGYIKKARDSTRLSDIQAIQAIAMASLTPNGQSISLDNLKQAIRDMNNGQLLRDPLDDGDLLKDPPGVCLGETINDLNYCEYYYSLCKNGGYVLRVRFESASNLYRYQTANEPLYNPNGEVHMPDSYDLGNCDEALTGNGDFGLIR